MINYNCFSVTAETEKEEDGRMWSSHFHICNLDDLTERLQESFAGRNAVKITLDVTEPCESFQKNYDAFGSGE